MAQFGQDPRIYESTVKEFIKDKEGKVKAVKIVKVAWRKNEKTGNMEIQEEPGTEKVLDCDLVLIAAGFQGSQNM